VNTVEGILQHLGVESVDNLDIGRPITIENPAYMALTIEKISEMQIVVGHYYRQMGDRMADPEIVFRVHDDDWIPIEYTQNPGIHRHDPNGLHALDDFVDQWDRTLRRQGFVEAAKEHDAVDE